MKLIPIVLLTITFALNSHAEYISKLELTSFEANYELPIYTLPQLTICNSASPNFSTTSQHSAFPEDQNQFYIDSDNCETNSQRLFIKIKLKETNRNLQAFVSAMELEKGDDFNMFITSASTLPYRQMHFGLTGNCSLLPSTHTIMNLSFSLGTSNTLECKIFKYGNVNSELIAIATFAPKSE